MTDNPDRSARSDAFDRSGAPSTRPRIAVTWMDGSRKSRRYLEAVAAAGGEPVALPAAGTESWAREVARSQGLLLTGGGDIAPTCYGESNDRCLSQGIEPRRDTEEMGALEFCLGRGLPVLAICRGFQLVNVTMGGRLLQDIEDFRGGMGRTAHRSGEQSSYHKVEVMPGTVLAGVLGRAGEWQVNSRHHQAVRVELVAPDLTISALSHDGLVEGLESPGEGFLVAVQWHPERTEEVPPEMARLFEALVERAKR